MIKLYFKIAVRNLLKYKTQNIISVVGLAVGIFCFTVCVYMGRFSEGTDRFYDNDGRIAVLGMYTLNDEGAKEYEFYSSTPVPFGEELRGKSVNGLEAVTVVWTDIRSYRYNVDLGTGKKLPYEFRALEVDEFYEKVFTPEIVAGSWSVAAKQQNSLVMSRSTAEKRFGSVEDAIGKRIELAARKWSSPSESYNGGVYYTVMAVMEDMPLNNSFSFMQHLDMLVMNDSHGWFDNPKHWKSFRGAAYTYALMDNSSSVAEINDELARLYKTYKEQSTGKECKVDCRAFPSYVETIDVKAAKIFGWSVAAIGTLILLVAFINLFYLLVGSFFNRIKEYSLMKLLGSNKKRIFTLIFIECMIMVLCAAFILFWLIEVFGNNLDFRFDLTNWYVHFNTGLMSLHAIEYIAFAILLCAIVSFVVTMYVSRIKICSGIYGGERKIGKHLGRKISLGVQFVVCWLFVILTASIFLQSRTVLKSKFDTLSMKQKKEILHVALYYGELNSHERVMLMDKFKGIVGVKDVMPGFYTAYTRAVKHTAIPAFYVPRNFFEFMNIPIVQGKALDNETEVVFDKYHIEGNFYDKEANAKTWQFEDNGKYYNVCGVSGYFTKGREDNRAKGNAYILQQPGASPKECYVKCNPGTTEDVKAEIERMLSEFLPESISPDVMTLPDYIADNHQLEFNMYKITLFFSLFSIIITLLGVYSSITIDTARRQKEVAIRKVFGAGLPQIILMFGKLYITLLSITAIIVFPMLYIVIHHFEGEYATFFNYGFFFWAFIFAMVSLLVLFTIIFKILQVASQNPAEVLKRE